VAYARLRSERRRLGQHGDDRELRRGEGLVGEEPARGSGWVIPWDVRPCARHPRVHTDWGMFIDDQMPHWEQRFIRAEPVEALARIPGAGSRVHDPIERVSPTDLIELAADVGPLAMQVAAILVLDTGSILELSSVREALAERIRGIPRLRQRLVRVPPGCGRPIWVDDPDFDIRDHVRLARCPAPGDERALLGVAADTATDRLPPGRPLWSATLVTGLADDKSALIVVFHHVLADGIGVLAVLAHIVDGVPAGPEPDFPRPPPSDRRLFVDAVLSRSRGLAHLPSGLWRLRGALAELRSAPARPPRCSLNRPTGPRRVLAVARADLADVRKVAHTHRGTVNDVVLAAVTGALHAVLRGRGEVVDSVVISVPVSARQEASVTQLGNQVGVIPVGLPATGDPLKRLQRTAQITRGRKTAPRAASAALLGPVFRTLARLGVLHWFVDHQRFVTTFVTNLRGPSTRLSFLAAPVTDVIPVSITTGNVTVAFAVLSYAGTLTVTVIADPDTCPDVNALAQEVQDQLDLMTGTGPSRTPVDRGEPRKAGSH